MIAVWAMVREETSHTRGQRERRGLKNTEREKEKERIQESEKNSAQAQSKVLSSFLLDLSGLVPNSWTFTDTSWCHTGELGTKRGGKHRRVDATWMLAGFVISSSLAFHKHHNVDLKASP